MSDPNFLSEQVLTAGLTPFLQQAVPASDFLYERPGTSSTVRRLFSYATSPTPLAATIEEQRRDANLISERVSYQTGPLTRASAVVVRSAKTRNQLPGLILFHCHSGVYRWGSEKLFAAEADSPALWQFRQEKYAGRSLAHDFAQAGFLVLVPDTFYFGRRALGQESIDAAANDIDSLRRSSELLVSKMLALAGHTWPALNAWEAQRALDYLYTRVEVDAHHIGCLGLSLGGFQSLLLAARDYRVTAAVSAGWLTTTADLLQGKIRKHSWMVLPWGVFPTPDFPAIAAAASPAALLVLLCAQDHLFTEAGMRTAATQLEEGYRTAGAADRCRTEFFDVLHSFTQPMQRRALAWLKYHLLDRRHSVSQV